MNALQRKALDRAVMLLSGDPTRVSPIYPANFSEKIPDGLLVKIAEQRHALDLANSARLEAVEWIKNVMGDRP